MGAPTEHIARCGCGAYGKVVTRLYSPTTLRYSYIIETENGEFHLVKTHFDPVARRYRQEHIENE